MGDLLPLYPTPSNGGGGGGWASASDITPAQRRDPQCSRCSLYIASKTRCVWAELVPGDETGTLHVIAGGPSSLEIGSSRPVLGDAGYKLRQELRKLWPGPVVYDHAVRCQSAKPGPGEISACRGFLSATLQTSKPARVLALGSYAFEAVTGRGGMRRAVGWIRRPDVAPVLMTHGLEVHENPILWKELVEDLAWATSTHLSHFQTPSPSKYQVVETVEEAADAYLHLKEAGFAFDCEWFAEPYTKEFRLLAVGCSPIGEDMAYVWGRVGLRRAEVVAVLRGLLQDPAVPKHGSELKVDIQAVLLGLGVRVQNEGADTRLWAKLLDPDGPGDLDTLAELVGMGGHKGEAEAIRLNRLTYLKAARGQEVKRIAAGQVGLFGRPEIPGCTWLSPEEVQIALNPAVSTGSVSYGLVEPAVLERYNARDAIVTSRLVVQKRAQLAKRPELQRTWDEVIASAAHAFARIEEWGMPVDLEQLRTLGVHFEIRLKEILGQIQKHAGPTFEPGSNPQVGKFLFEKLRLPSKKKTPTGQPSVDEEVLHAFREKHAVIPLILDYRSLAKLKGTYVDGFVEYVRADGRIHPRILLDGAKSGRPSCSEPNLQNIPRAETADGRAIRRLFAGNLWELDFSQLELRVACILSGDPKMLEIFQSGRDFHQETARLVAKEAWGLDPDKLGPEHRSAAKTINFSLVYGSGVSSLAAKLNVPTETAQRIYDAIMGGFPVLRDWIRGSVDYSRKHGGCWTWWNGHRARWRPLPDIGMRGDDRYHRSRRETAERCAYNTPCQGTGSDFLLASVGEVVKWIERTGSTAKVCITVHDSMLIETDDEAVIREALRIMGSWNSNGVPIVADIKRGPSWGDLTKFKF